MGGSDITGGHLGTGSKKDAKLHVGSVRRVTADLGGLPWALGPRDSVLPSLCWRSFSTAQGAPAGLLLLHFSLKHGTGSLQMEG